MLLQGTSKLDADGILVIGGVRATDLVKEFGTPLYVVDEAAVRGRCRAYREAFEATGLAYDVSYASKAFCIQAMCRLVAEEGLSLDVVSGGELYTAHRAGINMQRVHFHGNNKSVSELEQALDAHIGYFVVDNFTELARLAQLAQAKNCIANVMIRMTPGVVADTHAAIATGQEDSKFGFHLKSGQAGEAVRLTLDSPHLNWIGVHVHIGSQLFSLQPYETAARHVAAFAHTIKTQYGQTMQHANLGGGFGIRYTANDVPCTTSQYVHVIARSLQQAFMEVQLPMPTIGIEPGRSIIGEAGTTLYTIGAIKTIPHVRTYVAVDGGMTDNPRPALYDSQYEAMVANRGHDEATQCVSVAGKCCESGDMLLWDVTLPEVRVGDLLAVSCTGAYNYAMASNYNRLPRPAVVFVSAGQADLVVERETYDHLVARDRIPARWRA